MINYNCIIFDCDGVLVDSVPLSNEVLFNMLEPFGPISLFQHAIHNFQTGSLKKCLQEVERILQCKLPEDFEKDFRQRTFESFSKSLKPVPGAHELIDRLTIPFAVASSGPLEKIKHNLQLTNLLDRFKENIFSSYEINSWKPDPAIFIHAAHTMGFDPSECIVIEDSMDGIRAAIQGGFIPFALINPENKMAFEELGASVFYSLKEIELRICQ